LEEPIVTQEKPDLWGGIITLANGWRLELPEMAADTRLPITIEAKRLSEE
jgi:nitrogen fixation protein NifT